MQAICIWTQNLTVVTFFTYFAFSSWFGDMYSTLRSGWGYASTSPFLRALRNRFYPKPLRFGYKQKTKFGMYAYV